MSPESPDYGDGPNAPNSRGGGSSSSSSSSSNVKATFSDARLDSPRSGNQTLMRGGNGHVRHKQDADYAV